MASLAVVRAALVAALALVAGIWLGGHPDALPGAVRETLVDDGPALRAEVIRKIQDEFYRDVSKSKLEEESLKGLVRALRDPYSRYFTPREARVFEEDLHGRFEGVGMSVRPNPRGLEVVSVFKRSPAEKAGLRTGDVISRVNGRSIAGLAVSEAVDLIKGRPGTKVTLTYRVGGKAPDKRVRITRARIRVPVVTGEIVEHDGEKVAHIELTGFSTGAHGRLATEIRRLRKRGARGVVLDLRGNGGGLLSEAVRVSSVFVDTGVVVSTRGRAKPERKYNATGSSPAKDLPVVVLVDRGSASASEIVAGALTQRREAPLVGTRTFGKGVFQEIDSLSNGGALDITVGRYYLPDGKPLPRNGLQPDVRARDLPRTRRDEALPVALDTLARELR